MRNALRFMTAETSFYYNLKRKFNLVVLYLIMQYFIHMPLPHISFSSLLLLSNCLLKLICIYYTQLPHHTDLFYLWHIIFRMIVGDDFQIGSLPQRSARSMTTRDTLFQSVSDGDRPCPLVLRIFTPISTFQSIDLLMYQIYCKQILLSLSLDTDNSLDPYTLGT